MDSGKKKELEEQFGTLLSKVPQMKQSDLLSELTTMRKYLDKYDGLIVNLIQGVGLFLSRNVIERMQKTINDILDHFDQYSVADQEKIKTFLADITQRYTQERTLLDKILSILRNT